MSALRIISLGDAGEALVGAGELCNDVYVWCLGLFGVLLINYVKSVFPVTRGKLS